MNRYIKKVDQLASVPMFFCGFFFLIFFAGTLHLINVESPGIALYICNWCLFLLYPFFIVEAVIHIALGSPRWKLNLLYCLIPPLRICARDQMTGQAIWIPFQGWRVIDSDFREKISKTFSLPMLLIALLVLPLFAVEHYWQKQIEANPTLADLTAIATGFIWFAFTLEFIAMISIVEKRLDYCRKHWIDLAVICLPMIAFMRALRVAGLLKTARAFRIKSLITKLYRALLVLEVVDRLLQRNPEKRIRRLETLLLEKEKEITEIKEEINFLSERILMNTLPTPEPSTQPDSHQEHKRAA